MYNALRVGFVSVGLWMVVWVMARFRLGFRCWCAIRFLFSMWRGEGL